MAPDLSRAARRLAERTAAAARRLPGALESLGAWSLRSWKQRSAPSFFVLSFALLIAVGTAGLLWVPWFYTGAGLGLLDALFTITSAVCVTGLIVVDTATYFTHLGQLWILIFIQLGGIGVITLTTAIIGALGGKLSLRAELTGIPAGPRRRELSVWKLASDVARFTLIAEGLGAALLFFFWLPRFSVGEALWHAVFQSVSAFCNAGFSTFTTSLTDLNQSVPTLLVISLLIVLGGLGYITVRETWDWWRAIDPGSRRPHLSIHAYSVLITTGVLLLFGTVFYAIFEWHGVLASLSPTDRLANAWFMSVTARTAGFNSVPTGQLGNDAGFLTILLMFVGGSPGSTAGGLKTTTMAVLVALAWARIKGRKHAEIRGRGIPEETLERTVSLTLLALAVLTIAFFVLSTVTVGHGSLMHRRAAFLPMAFEVMSAFCTVGLSMGQTAALNGAGKIVIILLMFIGRVGLIAFFSALLLRRRRPPTYRPAREDLIVG